MMRRSIFNTKKSLTIWVLIIVLISYFAALLTLSLYEVFTTAVRGSHSFLIVSLLSGLVILCVVMVNFFCVRRLIDHYTTHSSDGKFRMLSDNAPIGVFSRSNSGRYEYTNRRWHDITGIDDAISFASYINPADVFHYQYAQRSVLGDKKPQSIEFRYLNPKLGERILVEYVSGVNQRSGDLHYMGSLLDVTELKIAQSGFEKLAFYDSLTQLPNRRFFSDHLELAMAEAFKNKTKIAVYMTDLDEFKKVNEALGHDRGDQLLIEISKRLGSAIFDKDIIARFGGDEFVVLVRAAQDRELLLKKASVMLHSMEAVASHGANDIKITGSIGIAVFPDDAGTREELFRCADLALYDAKARGGNCCSFYSWQLDKTINEKIQLENKLRKAVSEKALDVYFQPQYLADTKEMYWLEALVRWPDDRLGFIPPDQFIPLAEKTGLIFDVGDFVLDKVLHLLSQNIEKLESIGVQGVSVNLSAKQFFDDTFKEKILAKFRQYNISPKLIEFEITETTLMDDIDRAIEIMESLRAIGCRLSIDDFGTGSSSLSYLKKFPITSLKIDRSFISDIPEDENDVEIACAIIALAHNLGLTVVAEGVETEVQASFLAKNHCEYLQGYYFDQPMPFTQLFEREPLPSDGESHRKACN